MLAWGLPDQSLLASFSNIGISGILELEFSEVKGHFHNDIHLFDQRQNVGAKSTSFHSTQLDSQPGKCYLTGKY